MKNITEYFLNTYFGSALELHIRLFNVLVTISAVFCVIIAVVNVFAGIGFVGVMVDLVASAFCLALLFYASRSGHAQLCHFIFIIGSFFILFPYLFFKMGGYHGGIPVFLVFGVAFTVFMLEGKTVLITTTLELLLYAGMYIYSYVNPESVTVFPSEKGFLISNMMDLLVVGIALGGTMYAQVGVYRRQQHQLDTQNTILAEAGRAKTEFLANTSHEMRTPLTVISVNVQTVGNILEDMGSAVTDPDAMTLLADAQSEIMRLSRMVGGMLTLASLSEYTDKRVVDLTALLTSGAQMMELAIGKHSNALTSDVEAELTVFGNADLIVQVLSNLLNNAATHTENGLISLKAQKDGGIITTIVSDNGSGIPLELLPHVFERGVTDQVAGGTGFGLPLCKNVVESHGGKMWLESEPGKGTAVYFTLPVYEGQYGEETV